MPGESPPEILKLHCRAKISSNGQIKMKKTTDLLKFIALDDGQLRRGGQIDGHFVIPKELINYIKAYVLIYREYRILVLWTTLRNKNWMFSISSLSFQK